jgi:hypothetical protein
MNFFYKKYWGVQWVVFLLFDGYELIYVILISFLFYFRVRKMMRVFGEITQEDLRINHISTHESLIA